MGHRDFLCAIDSPYVDRLHDALHDSVPDVSPAEAVREVQAALLSDERTAFGYSREAWVEALLNMDEADLGQFLHAAMEPEKNMPALQRFSVGFCIKAWRIANNTEEV